MGGVTAVSPDPPAPQQSTSGDRPKVCPSCGARFPADALFCSLDGSPLTTSPGVIASAAATDPYLGREVLGHIEIRQLVGIGAMGRVYRAFQRGIDRDLAVKVLHRELSSNKALVARFDREAKVASRLAHPNVVHVLLVGQLPDGAMYIVMEYLDGLSLQSALAGALGAMPLPRALHIALQLCDAAGEGARAGDRPPRPEAREHHARAPSRRPRLRQGARLRHRAGALGRSIDGDGGGAHLRDRAVHLARRGARRAGGPGGRRLLDRHDALPDALRDERRFTPTRRSRCSCSRSTIPPPPLKGIARAAYVPDPIAAVIMKNLSKKPGDRARTTLGRSGARCSKPPSPAG